MNIDSSEFKINSEVELSAQARKMDLDFGMPSEYALGWRNCIEWLQKTFPTVPDKEIELPSAGDQWLKYVSQFEKLKEVWDSIPEPVNILLRQQIDIFAGKYPHPSTPINSPDDCSKHKKDLFGETDMKKVAERIGDLHYETLTDLLSKLSVKLYKDGLKDRNSSKEILGCVLADASNDVAAAASHIGKAWTISKPFMHPSAPIEDIKDIRVEDKERDAIDFAEWISSEGYMRLNKQTGHRWFKAENGHSAASYTTQELHNLFLSSISYGCESGDHDLVPILGYENEITGEQCRQCGKTFK